MLLATFYLWFVVEVAGVATMCLKEGLIDRLTIRPVLAGTVPVFKALSRSDSLKSGFFALSQPA